MMRVIRQIAHHLELEFLPSEQRFLRSELRGPSERSIPALENFFQVLAMIGDAAAGSSQRETWPEDYRVANPRREFEAVLDTRLTNWDWRRFETDLPHGIFEAITRSSGAFLMEPIFAHDQFDTITIGQNAGFGQINRKISVQFGRRPSTRARPGLLAADTPLR